MPATSPRVNVVLEEPLYDSIRRLARRDKVSLSLKVRDLVKDALEMEEDRGLTALAEERERTYDASKALTHEQIWGPHRRKRR
ncbi:MAG: antitoxin, RHH family protein [Nitrospirales bacterium]